ncbi:MAG: signal peptidase [Candidatus Woesearchaeota archaeon]|nr:signal peptidase [Candidatus Woesearchaeota archaeon]
MRRKKEINSGKAKTILLSLFIIALTFVNLIIANQIRKSLPRREILPFMSIEVVFNEGASFGILRNYPALVLILSLLIISALIIYLFYLLFHESNESKKKNSSDDSRYTIIGLCLTISGGLSNLLERIFFGNVIDYFRIGVWPNFNIADSMICIGVAFLIFSFIREGMKKE